MVFIIKGINFLFNYYICVQENIKRKKKHNRTKNVRGGVMNIYEFEMLKI